MNELYNSPAFVINMDRTPERLTITLKRVAEAGFTDIRRWRAIDVAEPGAIEVGWRAHGSPKFDPLDGEFSTYRGKQACFLSHVSLLRHIIDNKIPRATIFEDDVLFHKDWANIAPKYWEATPACDLLYLGAQLDAPSAYMVDMLPVFCTHAMVVTAAGAERIYNALIHHPAGVSTIDCMLLNYERLGPKAPFSYLVWNGLFFPDDARAMPKDWTKRNSGLVYQEYSLGTYVREW